MASHILFSRYFAKIKVDSYDSLPMKNILALHNALMKINAVLNKDKNLYYYKIFLEKWLYQWAKNDHKMFFYNIIMVKFEKTEIAKEKFYAAKKTYKNLGCYCW